ncbi:MAG: endolytic transglycosylase MltG [Patescibacteria group bacterium]|nr:endolytic transglycosylase MltG [Patescibacteria group bacterium]
MSKFLKVTIFFLFLLPILFFGARAYYKFALNREAQIDTPKTIIIEPGMGISEIATLLSDQGVINSEVLFIIYVKLNHGSAKLQAGEYQIPADLNLKEVVELLQHGTFDINLTFLEGWRREQMAEYLQKDPRARGLENISGDEFLALTQGEEGYLFPDTYRIPRDTSTKELVDLMRKTFAEKVGEDLREDAKETGLSFPEVIVLASVVEREVPSAEDRSKVAGILIKRLQNNWPLEADATVQYAVANVRCGEGSLECENWWPNQLTKTDLALDDPYNTRKHKGLPPAPICNPGIDSIKAVVNYEKSPYWFYLSDKEGNTHYSKTLDEHQQKVLKYLSG